MRTLNIIILNDRTRMNASFGQLHDCIVGCSLV